MRVALLFLILAGACTSRPKTRCQEVCRRETECADLLDVPDVDRGECVTSCTALDRGEDTRKLVDRHVTCVKSAPDCRAALDCP